MATHAFTHGIDLVTGENGHYEIQHYGRRIETGQVPFNHEAGDIAQVSFQEIGDDGNIAFRYGRDNDMQFVAAVRGDTTFSSVKQHEWWMHGQRNIIVEWEKPNIVCFIGNNGRGDRSYVTFNGQTWVRS